MSDRVAVGAPTRRGEAVAELLDPTHEHDTAGFAAPARLATLAGTTVGVISNGKENTRPFFDHVERLLRDRHGVAKVIRGSKTNYSAPAQHELLAEAMGWDAVLAGVGD